jgi:hypothetical protein
MPRQAAGESDQLAQSPGMVYPMHQGRRDPAGLTPRRPGQPDAAVAPPPVWRANGEQEHETCWQPRLRL